MMKDEDKAYQEIEKALKKAFLNSDENGYLSYSPSFVYNDPDNNKKVINTLKEELRNCDAFFISVAFITKHGLQLLKETFQELKNKGVKGKILTTDYLCFTQPDALKDIKNNLENIEVRMYKTSPNHDGFHTKGYIIKQDKFYKLIIGSSNLTASALSTNNEWNTKLIATEKGQFKIEVIQEFEKLWSKATPLDDYLNAYEEIYIKQKQREQQENKILSLENIKLSPNYMQIQFCNNLKKLIDENKDRGLLISATGTGKTFASAFGVRKANAKHILFLAHRTHLLSQAISAYKKVLPIEYTFAILTGDRNYTKELENVSSYQKGKLYNILFSTCEMMQKDEILQSFNKNCFDFIIIDEVHKAGSKTYQKIINYFTPKFLLGMSATPERTDDETLIYNMFDHNIIFEIRLQDALEYDLLCPFHYYGITDILGINDDTYKLEDFNRLYCDERINYIIKQSQFYGFSGDRLRGLIFVSSKKDGYQLENKLKEKGYKIKFLSGEDSQSKREYYIQQLEEKDIDKEYLDFIITVDIFNEGVDIPEVNQIIMLRPTISSIIFIQQLGRGLRKWQNKDYVVIIDFIGNYNNNYMIPKAFASTSDKQACNMLIASEYLPGISSIEFDEIARNKIFDSIQNTNFDTLINFKNEYIHLKNKLNRIPSLCDFIFYSNFDPYRIFISNKADSYLDFLIKIKELNKQHFNQDLLGYLKTLNKVLYKGLRLDEAYYIKSLINNENIDDFIKTNNLSNKKIITIKNQFLDDYYHNNNKFPIITNDNKLTQQFKNCFDNNIDFKNHVLDTINFSIARHDKYMQAKYLDTDFTLFARYSRDDVSVLLNLCKSRSSTLYGYQYLKEQNAFPIFVNYIKSDDISILTNYEDIFIDAKTFSWISRHGEKINSKNMQALINQKNNNLKIHLFIRKSISKKDKDPLHYYLGEVIVKNYEQFNKNNTTYVKFIFELKNEVRQDIYDYLCSNIKIDKEDKYENN